jgi:hypothetical protein
MGKKSKKLMKAAALAGAAYLASKHMGKSPATDTGDLGSEQANISRNISAESQITSGAVKQQMKKAAAKAASARESEMFGLGAMDGAKDGKMIKAKGGRMVSLGQGIVMRPKKTIIS